MFKSIMTTSSRLSQPADASPDPAHRGRLIAFRPFLLGDLDPHLTPDRQLAEPVVEDGVAVEVHLVAVAGQDDAVAVVREQPHHFAVRRCGVSLDVAAHLARGILELARDGGEGVADRHIDVLVSVIFRSRSDPR